MARLQRDTDSYYDKEVDLLIREYDICFESAYNDYRLFEMKLMMESSPIESLKTTIQKQKESSAHFIDFVKKTCEPSVKFINDFVDSSRDAISDMKNDETYDTYMYTEVSMTYDFYKYTKDVEKKIRETETFICQTILNKQEDDNLEKKTKILCTTMDELRLDDFHSKTTITGLDIYSNMMDVASDYKDTYTKIVERTDKNAILFEDSKKRKCLHKVLTSLKSMITTYTNLAKSLVNHIKVKSMKIKKESLRGGERDND